jgi:hypothetical protein
VFPTFLSSLLLPVYCAAGVPAVAFTLAVACVPIAPMAPY